MWGLNYSVMPHSPEWRFLLEQRARLAEVLHFDDMTDEELATFHRYVRGNRALCHRVPQPPPHVSGIAPHPKLVAEIALCSLNERSEVQ